MTSSRLRHARPVNVRAVLWDLDGTLVASEGAHEELENEVLESLGVAPDPALFRAFVGRTARDHFREALGRAGKAALLDLALLRKAALSGSRIALRVVPVRGAEAALHDLPSWSHPYALVTSCERALAETLLDRFGWAGRFSAIVAAEDVERTKPDPEPYALACERLGVPPAAALAVEDAPNGIRSARAAGCKVAAVAHTFPPSELQEAHYVLSDLGAVVALVRRLG